MAYGTLSPKEVVDPAAVQRADDLENAGHRIGKLIEDIVSIIDETEYHGDLRTGQTCADLGDVFDFILEAVTGRFQGEAGKIIGASAAQSHRPGIIKARKLLNDLREAKEAYASEGA